MLPTPAPISFNLYIDGLFMLKCAFTNENANVKNCVHIKSFDVNVASSIQLGLKLEEVGAQ